MSTHTRRLLLTGSALAVIALPAAVGAQMLDPIHVTDSRLKAEKLEQEAIVIEQGDWNQLRKAARLREAAAELRAPDDPAGTVSLYWAARDRYYSDDTRKARDLMEATADRAIAMGDVLNAATAYTEAAYISADLKDGARVRLLVGKATLLAASPLLSDDQRHQLRTRLARSDAPVGVVAVLTNK